METNKKEDIVRGLTISQLDALRAVIESPIKVLSSQKISKNLKHGSGKSLSALASLSKMKPRVIKKVGKISAREGLLWAYDDEFLPIEKTREIVRDIFDFLYKSEVLSRT